MPLGRPIPLALSSRDKEKNSLTCSRFSADSDEGDDGENGVDAGEGESGEKSPVKKGKEKKTKGMASFSGGIGHVPLY